jgi:hypothetical protein
MRSRYLALPFFLRTVNLTEAVLLSPLTINAIPRRVSTSGVPVRLRHAPEGQKCPSLSMDSWYNFSTLSVIFGSAPSE